jgi:hypothetical protein
VAEFDSIEAALGQHLPANYKSFLMESNGGKTKEPLPRLRLYGLQELIASIAGEKPEVLEIASGDNDAYAFDLTVNRDSSYYPVVKYPLGQRGRKRMRRVSRHFLDFLAMIAAGQELEWHPRINIRSAKLGTTPLHASDQPEDAFNVQLAWEDMRNSWFAHPAVDSSAEFDAIAEVLGQPLPSDYKWFMMKSNGGESLEPLERVALYRLEELLPRREDGHPPDVLEFATDDSDGYAFDLTVRRDSANYPVVKYSLGEQDRTYMECVSRSFAEFLAIIASGEAP